MPIQYHLWGEPIARGNLKLPRAIEIARAVGKYPFTTYIESRRNGVEEGVVIDFETELPQNPPVPILGTERLLIGIPPDDHKRPAVLVLRQNFPEVLHLNLSPKGDPKELCIFEEDYREVRAWLTPRLLLDRIADWLARAATEELHLLDQPLEPFILTSDRIIFDRDIFEANEHGPPVVLVCLRAEHPVILRAYTLPNNVDLARFKKDAPVHLVLPLTAQPWHSRLINHQPVNFLELTALFKQVGIDIEDEARRLLRRIYDQGKFDLVKRHRLIPIIKLPKSRSKGGPAESIEWWAFVVETTIDDLAVKLDLRPPHQDTFHIPLRYKPTDLDKVLVAAIRPTFALSKRYARVLSGGGEDDPAIVAVGAGALGSQIILNLARQGFGKWTIIDDDHLLPHNLVRHALSVQHEGLNKASALAYEICELLHDEQAARAGTFDILRPPGHDDGFNTAIRCADVILDFSASHAVARFLADADYCAPRLCAYLSPLARHLIILAEGQDRALRLDDLEVQSKAAIAEDEQFHDVFTNEAPTIGYAGSCRDASVQMAQDVVAIHSAAAAHFIKRQLFATTPSIDLWKWSSSTFSLTRHQIPVYSVLVEQAGDWSIRISSHAVHGMRYHRRRNLPNETGGVALGRIDSNRKIIYVATILASPPDSVQWPTAYIRGAQGLEEAVGRLNRLAGGDICYVGEWHSHPEGHSSEPSEDDRNAHRGITHEMGRAGLPGLVLIQGTAQKPHIMFDLE